MSNRHLWYEVGEFPLTNQGDGWFGNLVPGVQLLAKQQADGSLRIALKVLPSPMNNPPKSQQQPHQPNPRQSYQRTPTDSYPTYGQPPRQRSGTIQSVVHHAQQNQRPPIPQNHSRAYQEGGQGGSVRQGSREDSSPCNSCGQLMYWGTTKSGKPHPYDDPERTRSHFDTCPNAASHRRGNQ